VLWLIPAICGLLAVGCVVAGVVPVLRANRIVNAHFERLSAALPVAVVDGARLQAALGRVTESSTAAQTQVARISFAVGRIADGVRDLRLREAMLSLRVAGAALRALRELL
jgi:hypothetical protein